MKIGTIIGYDPQHTVKVLARGVELEEGEVSELELLVIAHIPKYMSLIENYVIY